MVVSGEERNYVKKKLQVLNTLRGLWLLYSHEKVGLIALKQAIDDKIKRQCFKRVPFALVYTNIQEGKKFSAKNKGTKPNKAIHIEVAEQNAKDAKILF